MRGKDCDTTLVTIAIKESDNDYRSDDMNHGLRRTSKGRKPIDPLLLLPLLPLATTESRTGRISVPTYQNSNFYKNRESLMGTDRLTDIKTDNITTYKTEDKQPKNAINLFQECYYPCHVFPLSIVSWSGFADLFRFHLCPPDRDLLQVYPAQTWIVKLERMIYFFFVSLVFLVFLVCIPRNSETNAR